MHRIEVADPSLIVLIGAAGAGKTTFAARHFAAGEILSSDAYREMIAGDPGDQRATGIAFRRLHETLARRLRDGRLTVVDATNLTTDARRSLLRRAVAARRPASAIVLAPPDEVVHARNAARDGRVVPRDVVDRHLRMLHVLLATDRLEAEGFAAVDRLDGVLGAEDVVIVRRRSQAPPSRAC